MSAFIKLDIDLNKCLGLNKCDRCIQVCPVDVFASSGEYPVTVEAHEDECTLCNLCLQRCEVDAISLHKLYEE